MQVQPYLIFAGRCEEALDFYRRALGAEVRALLRFKDAPDAPPGDCLPAGQENRVMHAELAVGSGVVMCSDGMPGEAGGFKGFSLALQAADADLAQRLYGALAAGGQPTMPLGKTFWSPCFGMLVDRFGVSWMINVAPAA